MWPLRASKMWNGVRCTREAVVLGKRIVVTEYPPVGGTPTSEFIHASEELARTGLLELAKHWADDGFCGEDGFSIACMDPRTVDRDHCGTSEAIEPSRLKQMASSLSTSAESPSVADGETQALFFPRITVSERRTPLRGIPAPCDQCGVNSAELLTSTCSACGHELRDMSPQERVCHLLAAETQTALAARRVSAWRAALADINALPVGIADRQTALASAAARLRAWELASEGGPFPGAQSASTPVSGPALLRVRDATGAPEHVQDKTASKLDDLMPRNRRPATHETASDLDTIPQAILAVLFVAWLIYVMT